MLKKCCNSFLFGKCPTQHEPIPNEWATKLKVLINAAADCMWSLYSELSVWLLYKIINACSDFLIKAAEPLQYNSSNTLIIDDYDEVYNTQNNNCIHIKPFEFSEKNSHRDKYLKHLKHELIKMNKKDPRLAEKINKNINS